MPFFGSQNVGMPTQQRVTIVDATARGYNWYGKQGAQNRKRIIGSFVWFEYVDEEGKTREMQYSVGKLDNTCPAQTTAGPVPWKQLNLESPAIEEQLRGKFLWSFLPDPSVRGHIPSSCNFALLAAELEKCGYPADRIDISHPYLDLGHIFDGWDVTMVLIPQPVRPNLDKAKDATGKETETFLYVPETHHGFVTGAVGGGSAIISSANAFADNIKVLLTAGVIIPITATTSETLMPIFLTNVNLTGFNFQVTVESMPAQINWLSMPGFTTNETGNLTLAA